jgi:hypothetical protein
MPVNRTTTGKPAASAQASAARTIEETRRRI